MRVRYFGHACFSVEIGGKHLLFDPFVSPNPLAAHIDVNEIQADLIFISHGHQDHIHDCEAIANRTGATVVSNFEIHNWLQKKGVAKTFAMNTGGKADFGYCLVKAVVAHHSSSMPDGTYGGNPLGFVCKSQAGSFYYSGDTALTMDMQWIPSFVPPDLVLLPIGDTFTMGMEDAVKAAHLVSCRRVMGLHYDTFPSIRIDKSRAISYFEKNGLELLLPDPGSTIDL